jgi:hypothetical protein
MAMSAEVRIWMGVILLTVVATTLPGRGQDTQEIKALCAKAEEGDAIAQCRLGDHYYSGHGVSKDLVQAVKWYTKAAEQGNAQAQFSLGLCHYNGDGIPKDMSQAVKWYKRAADLGNVQAQVAYSLLTQSEPFDIYKVCDMHFTRVKPIMKRQEDRFIPTTDIHYKCVVPGEELRPILEHLTPVADHYYHALMIGSLDAQLDYDGKDIGIQWNEVKGGTRRVLIVTIEGDGRGKQMLDDPYGEQFLDAVHKHYEETGRTPHQSQP